MLYMGAAKSKLNNRQKREIADFRNTRLLEMSDKTAGVLIVGDEILKGRVVDTNSPFIVKRLYNLGVRVKKISVVPDDVNVIAEEVLLFSKQFDIVITTGGIGPTHDDVTYEGISKAFNDELTLNKELKEWVSSFADGECTDHVKNPAIRMARVPKSASLLRCKKGVSSRFLDTMPIVCVANVYVFPGIPSYLQHLFMKLEHVFKPDEKFNSVFFDQCLYFNTDELNMLEQLNLAVEKYPDVTFGSYPILDQAAYVTKITLESSFKDKIWEAEKYFLSLLPKGSLVKKDAFHADDIISSIYHRALKLPKSELVGNVKKSLQIVEQCLKKYNLHLKIVPGPVKNALASVLAEKPNLKAVLMGTRRTDPYSDSLKSFQMTDADWPQVMRVSPILDWSYQDIWIFLRELNVPYCCLYDQGYSSIGSYHNTVPNPRLQYKDDNGEIKYHPAYLLKDEKSERSGRN